MEYMLTNHYAYVTVSTSHNTYNSLDKFSLLNFDQYFSNILKEDVLANQNTKARCFRMYENSDNPFLNIPKQEFKRHYSTNCL